MKHEPIITPDNPILSTSTVTLTPYSQEERTAYREYRRLKGVDATRAKAAYRAWIMAKARDAAGIAADLQGRV